MGNQNEPSTQKEEQAQRMNQPSPLKEWQGGHRIRGKSWGGDGWPWIPRALTAAVKVLAFLLSEVERHWRPI